MPEFCGGGRSPVADIKHWVEVALRTAAAAGCKNARILRHWANR